MDPIDFTTVIFVPSFVLFIYVMKLVFFNPVAKVIEERDGSLEGDKQRAKECIKTAESKLTEYEEELAKARHEASSILHGASQDAHDQKQKMVMEVSDSLHKEKLKALAELNAEQDKSIANLGGTIKEITSIMVAKVLAQDVNLDLSDERIKKAFDKKVEVGV